MKVLTRTIGVAGALTRIGTTTQAIQIVKYLDLVGYPAAYIELCNHAFINSCVETYADIKKTRGRFSLCDVNMYHSVREVEEEYAFLVKDYGNFNDRDFNRISFLEQDIKVIVCGAKSDELPHTEEILRTQEFPEASYIFTFVPDDVRKSIIESMNGYATYFVEYTPDPFCYPATQNKLYKSALGL
ncbi:MAG: hypothetical protein KH230_09780 [Enterocloster asparagiformis]|nr:hypothetical protein [Enterocloster asparagiformis]